ncbi:MAG: Na+/H+ antiporter NhaC [Lachnospiraceae bacterium]|nr:Na+/H+ antiporter NhaC [Lachnospiraceae bacterium]
MSKEKEERMQISMRDSLILMAVIIVEIVVCVRLGLALVIPLLMTWLIMYIYAVITKRDWHAVEGYALDGVRAGFQSIMIVAAVGCLIGAWILSGTVPTLIYYGLRIVSPGIFLPATMILCSILSVCTGTSYGSAASAGLACMGIGLSMGFPAGVIAGAVICGALFGDKLSPFSDTTNLSSAMAGSTLFGHIRSMLWTTVPSWLISVVIFAVIGHRYSVANYDPTTIEEYLGGLSANFNLSVLTLIPVILVIVLLLFKVPAFPTIMLGAVGGGITAMIAQGSTFKDVMTAMLSGYSIESGILLVDKLLNRGGIASMYSIICIMIFAMGMGGMLDKMGILNNLLGLFVKKIKNVPGLVVSTMLVSYLSSAIGCTQSMSHVLTGKLMNPIFREKGVAPEVLSRTMEDCGTLGGAMMPWHTNAIYFCGALGVTFAEYIPYLYLSFLAPLFALLFAFTGFAVWYIDPATGERIEKSKAPVNK